VVGVWRDGQPVATRLAPSRRDRGHADGRAVAAFVLFVFRAAQARISRQTDQLLEAARRDPLADTPNRRPRHRARRGRPRRPRRRGSRSRCPARHRQLPPAQRHHGAAATGDPDSRLELLGVEFPTGAILNRYGPDQFLVTECRRQS
jgi:hypothetical protein